MSLVGAGWANLKSVGKTTRKSRLELWGWMEAAVHRWNFFLREAVALLLRAFN